MLRLAFMAFAAVLLTACGQFAPAAQEAPWKVAERDGVVRVEQAGQPVRDLLPDEVLTYGAIITTGADSSAKIANGLQTLTMAANSRVSIPAGRTEGMTAIFQSMGSVLFQVDHRQAAHFRVETPLLTAIVKGTTFRVGLNSEAATVSVINGLVEVRAAQGDAHRDVPGGYAARVAAATPEAVELVSKSDLASAGFRPALTPTNPGSIGALAAGDIGGERAGPASPLPAANGPNSFGQMGGSVWVIVGYVAATLVAWVVFVFLFLLCRAMLRDAKGRSTIKRRSN